MASPCGTATNVPLDSAVTSDYLTTKKRQLKSHVKTACVNCKKAHLACDLSRPCKRCVSSGKADSCHDIQHKKRGRPKLQEKRLSANVMKLMQGYVSSSFSMTRSPDTVSTNRMNDHQPTMTVFLSMELCCARVSDESLSFIGLYPQEFSHRSLYDFIAPDDISVVGRIHRSLLDNAAAYCSLDDTEDEQSNERHIKKPRLLPPTQRATSDFFSYLQPLQLLTIANGSLTLKETISFKTSNENRHQTMQASFYLGGGGGADLFKSSSLQHLYIVCILLRPGNDHSVDSANLALPNEATLHDPYDSSRLPVNIPACSYDPFPCHVNSSVASPPQEQPPLTNMYQDDDSPFDNRPLTPSSSAVITSISSATEDNHSASPFFKESMNSPIELTDATVRIQRSDSDREKQSSTLESPASSTSSVSLPSSSSSFSSVNLTTNAGSATISRSETDKVTCSSRPASYIRYRRSSTLSVNKTLSKTAPTLSSSLYKDKQREICLSSRHQQPHQLYYQTMLSSRLSGEAQAFVSSDGSSSSSMSSLSSSTSSLNVTSHISRMSSSRKAPISLQLSDVSIHRSASGLSSSSPSSISSSSPSPVPLPINTILLYKSSSSHSGLTLFP